MPGKKHVVLMADDDCEDVSLVKEAFAQIDAEVDFKAVHNGQELLEYLYSMSEPAQGDSCPRPDLVLLDLNMPIKGGFEVLREIKNNLNFRSIPVVIFSTSLLRADIKKSYELSANAYFAKPPDFDRLVTTLRLITDYWFETACLPDS